LGGCTGVLGDFTVGGSGGEDSGPTVDGNLPPPTDASSHPDTNPPPPVDAGTDGGQTDAAEAGPPPTPGKAGLDLTTGGTYSKSAKFSMWAAVGESPGGNTVSKSASFKLQGGVVAGTQP
jgi:hypothetical protein